MLNGASPCRAAADASYDSSPLLRNLGWAHRPVAMRVLVLSLRVWSDIQGAILNPVSAASV